MSDFLKRVGKGVKAALNSFGPGRFSAAGHPIICPHCKNSEFEEGSAQLNTAGLTFLGLDWLNKSATVLVCTNCGLIQWFGKAPDKM